VQALSRVLRRDLKRQIRKLTPWHVRVTVRSSAETTTVRIWSARWFSWQSSRFEGVLPDHDPLLFLVEAVCLDVQNFMCGETARWWPTDEPVETLGDGERTVVNHVLPHARRSDQQVVVEWRQGDRTVLTFDPLHV
jgi:hypothetical protein